MAPDLVTKRHSHEGWPGFASLPFVSANSSAASAEIPALAEMMAPNEIPIAMILFGSTWY